MKKISAPLYATAIFFSRTGSGLFFFINTWILIHLTGNSASAAISLLIAVIPSIFLSMIIGSVADKFPAIKLVLSSEITRFLILFAYASLFMTEHATPLLAYSVSFLMSICAEIQLISWRVILAKHTSQENNFKLNALSVTSGQAGVVAGATCSGILFVYFGAALTIYIASGAFLISSICVAYLASALHTPRPVTNAKIDVLNSITYHLRSIRDGFQYIVGQPSLIGYYLLILLNINILYMSNALLAPFVKGPLNLNAEAYGKIDAAYSIGAIAGGLIIVRLTRRLGAVRITLLGLAILAVSLFSFARSDAFLIAFCSYIGIGLGCQTSIVSLSRAQRTTAAELHGRSYATFNTITGCFGVLVFILSTRFTTPEELRNIFEYQAIAVTTVLLAISCTKKFKNALRTEYRP